MARPRLDDDHVHDQVDFDSELDCSSLSSLSKPCLYTLLQPITVPTHSKRARFNNWARTFSCSPLAIFVPEDTNQCALILELARREGRRVRFAGVGHSPSDIACTTEYMLVTTKLNRVLRIDTEKQTVVVQAGIVLNDLHKELAMHGLALSVLGSISDQTLAGVLTTPTHGTGTDFGIMATYVLALTLLLADGSQLACSPTMHSDVFFATLSGLGATGLILDVKLQVESAFRLRELQATIDFDDFLNDFDALANSAEHVRFWWFAQGGKIRINAANRTEEEPSPAGSWLWDSLFGIFVLQLLLFLGRFFTPLIAWTNLFAEWLARGDVIRVDHSYTVFNVDCRIPHYTTEWAVPYHDAHQCLRELRDWLERESADPLGIRPHFPIEIRCTDADDIWLSPSYGQRMCWIGLLQYKPFGFPVPYRRFFAAFEDIAQKFGGRPHWAKAHPLRPAELRTLYPRFDDYIQVLERVDPERLFCNEYVRRHILGEEGSEVDSRVFRQKS